MSIFESPNNWIYKLDFFFYFKGRRLKLICFWIRLLIFKRILIKGGKILNINFKSKRRKKKKIGNDLASEIVEIIEEKMDDVMKLNLPVEIVEVKDEQIKFREDLRKDLVYEISDFLYSNMEKRKVA